jgi:chemotaxis family two-component system response regulator Rcp1
LSAHAHLGSDDDAARTANAAPRLELTGTIMSHEFVGRPMEILLVEDNMADAGLAIESLKSASIQHRLTLTVDGIEAMEFLHRQGVFHQAPRPDIVLLDLGLPKKGGQEVLAEMRADERLKRIPVVVLTASAGDGAFLEPRLLGVDAYMTKPVDKAKFLSVVRELRHRWFADVILPKDMVEDEAVTAQPQSG